MYRHSFFLLLNIHHDEDAKVFLNGKLIASLRGYVKDYKEIDVTMTAMDVLQTGRTTRAAMNVLFDYGRPSSILLAVLVERSGRELPIQADYTAIEMGTSSSQRVDVLVEEEDGRDAILVRDL